ncbi:uncharacterized protein LOC119692329 isoform X2 [Plutella xylostella]|uniref:uncharacterized protein LOC119692329 isoform X2 n=1 Tax=Plutella xylostella TaxID=51655 RepID=UPI0020327826|nr:uncharacterized protein LOC119692329 isoform X2 [Plutella xylostella]
MNSKVYKWCAVPQCKNTSITTPNKVFVHVPYKKIIRHKWLKLARRNPNDVKTNSPLYFCEDHFDLPNDMENFMEYHVMGSVSQFSRLLKKFPNYYQECWIKQFKYTYVKHLEVKLTKQKLIW